MYANEPRPRRPLAVQALPSVPAWGQIGEVGRLAWADGLPCREGSRPGRRGQKVSFLGMNVDSAPPRGFESPPPALCGVWQSNCQLKVVAPDGMGFVRGRGDVCAPSSAWLLPGGIHGDVRDPEAQLFAKLWRRGIARMRG